MADVIRPRCGPYIVSFKWIDYDAEEKEEECQTWDDACRFMRGLLIDGYEVTGVAFC